MSKKTIQKPKDQHVIIQELQQKVEELTNNWKRSLADYQNLRKRTETDRNDFVKFVSANIFVKLIPVLDILEMAVAHSDDQGLRLAVKNFQDVLRSENLQEIVPQPDDPFDAAVHECMETVALPSDSSVKEHTIAEMVLKGYKIDTFVIRPAKVKVWQK